MVKTLYIIGNGVDIYHGIKSRYSDYCAWLEKNAPDVCQKLCTIYDVNDENDWWSDFEQNLAKINFDYLATVYGEQRYEMGTDDFCDADNHRGFIQVEIDICDVLKSVKRTFYKWVLELNNTSVKRCFYLEKKESFFLTLNYTKTLEKVYGIPQQQIFHIHGSLDGEDFVLGHGKTVTELYKEIKGPRMEIPNGLTEEQLDEWITFYCDDSFMDSIIDAAAVYLAKLQKNVKQIVLKNQFMFKSFESVVKIYILGFSFSSIDIPYLEELIKYVNTEKVLWVVSFYNDRDIKRIEEFRIKHSLNEKLWKMIKLNSLCDRRQRKY